MGRSAAITILALLLAIVAPVRPGFADDRAALATMLWRVVSRAEFGEIEHPLRWRKGQITVDIVGASPEEIGLVKEVFGAIQPLVRRDILFPERKPPNCCDIRIVYFRDPELPQLLADIMAQGIHLSPGYLFFTLQDHGLPSCQFYGAPYASGYYQGQLGRTVILVRTPIAREFDYACAIEEIIQSFGLLDDIDEPDTIFNEDPAFNVPTARDLGLLCLYYALPRIPTSAEDLALMLRELPDYARCDPDRPTMRAAAKRLADLAVRYAP